jgi:hypothetical protein
MVGKALGEIHDTIIGKRAGNKDVFHNIYLVLELMIDCFFIEIQLIFNEPFQEWLQFWVCGWPEKQRQGQDHRR